MDDIAVVVLWNVTALVARAVALVALGGALADWEFLRIRRLNGLRSIQAGANLRTQGTRVLVSLLFLVIGILVLLDVPWRVDVSRWSLIAASVALTAGSAWDWVDRRRMQHQIMRTEREVHRIPEGHA